MPPPRRAVYALRAEANFFKRARHLHGITATIWNSKVRASAVARAQTRCGYDRAARSATALRRRCAVVQATSVVPRPVVSTTVPQVHSLLQRRCTFLFLAAA